MLQKVIHLHKVIGMHPYLGSFVMKPSDLELAITVLVILGLHSHYPTQPHSFDSSLFLYKQKSTYVLNIKAEWEIFVFLCTCIPFLAHSAILSNSPKSLDNLQHKNIIVPCIHIWFFFPCRKPLPCIYPTK